MTAGAVWRIHPGTGASTNGGAYDASQAGGTGVDYSGQDSAQATGTATSATTTVTATTPIFDNTMLGNCITDGTTFVIITGFTSSTIVTVDASPSWTSATIFVGGAQSSIDVIFNKIIAGNTINIKKGSDSITASRSLTAGSISAPVLLRGFNVTPGDLTTTSTVAGSHLANGRIDTTNFPTIALGGFSLTISNHSRVEGINFTASVNAAAVIGSVTNGIMFRCKVVNSNTGSSALAISLFQLANDCDLASVTASGGYTLLTVAQVDNTFISSTNGGGINTAGNLSVAGCVFWGMAASQNAINLTSGTGVYNFHNNTFDNIAGTCILLGNQAISTPLMQVWNNQVSNCGTFLNNGRSGTTLARFYGWNNRIRNTTTSYTGWIDNTASIGDITTADTDANEYVDIASQNFRLKYGALGRGKGLPYGTSIGAFQYYPVLPDASMVKTGTSYGQDNSTLGTFAEIIGTLILVIATGLAIGIGIFI